MYLKVPENTYFAAGVVEIHFFILSWRYLFGLDTPARSLKNIFYINQGKEYFYENRNNENSDLTEWLKKEKKEFFPDKK